MATRVAYEFGGFRFEPYNARLIYATGVILLPSKAADTLAVLVRQPDVLVSKEDLISAIWPDTVVEENNLSQQISTLRRLLSAEGGAFIETVPRRGYRFVAAVRAIAVPDPALEVSPPASASGLPPSCLASPDGPETAGAGVGAGQQSGIVAESTGGTGLPGRGWLRYGAVAAVLLLTATPLAWHWQRAREDIRTSHALRELGDALMQKGDPRGALAEYQRAIRLNPTNALAYAALAHALHKQSDQDSVRRIAGASPSVEAAQRAVSLDPQCGSCHGTLGFFLFYHDWEWARAEEHLREALRLEPERESIRPAYALLLAATGRVEQARHQIDFALNKQPYHTGWRVMRASFLYLQRRHPEAVEAADQALALNDRDSAAWEWRSKALFQLRRDEEAVRALAQVAFASESPGLERAVRDGGSGAGLQALLDVTSDWRKRTGQTWRRAAWRALLNDSEGALEELERACEYRNYNLIYIGTDPVYDGIRRDPRFQSVLARMGLAAAFDIAVDEVATGHAFPEHQPSPRAGR